MTKKAKRQAARPKKTAAARARRRPATGSAKRSAKKPQPAAAAKARPKQAPAKRATHAPMKSAKQASTKNAKPALAPKRKQPAKTPGRAPGLERERRTLQDTVEGPPSSLDLDRHASAVRTGRAELVESLREHRGMEPDITGGDVDVNVEDAYFTGDEAPGGDNPTPDQEIVDDIGRALGVEYQDNEELKAVDKVTERDRKRWELDPASSEDYKERK
jgi:uncharacterized protein DUF6335